MRVLIIPSPPPPESQVTSGVGRYLTALTRHAPQGIEYAYLAPEDEAYGNPHTMPPASPRRAPRTASREMPGGKASTGDGPTGETARTRRASAIRLILGYARDTLRVARILRRYRSSVDLIHVNFVGCETQTLAARLAGFRRVVTTVHNLPGYDVDAMRWPRRVIEQFSFACGDRHIVVAEAVYTAWRERVSLPRSRVACIYNGMEYDGQVHNGLLRPGSGPVYGICARLHPMKGHRVLLEAFDRVLRKYPDARLVIAGEGPLRESLAAEIERRGMGGRVDMTGYVHDTLRFMAGLDVHVHPSVFLEAMPYAVIEAMFAGRPQVVSDVGGAQEVIAASGGGKVVPREDAAALAAAMLDYAADAGARSSAGRQARDYAALHLTAQHMAEQTATVYGSICGP